MSPRSQTYLTLSWLTCVLVLAAVVLVNAVFARTAVRLDLTEERIYTVSDGTRRILEKMEDPATVKVFWGGIPAELDPTRQYLEALLSEMQGIAGDHLQVQWVDMDDEEGPKEAQKYGIEEWSFGTRTGSEQRLSNGYMSMVVEMGDQRPALFNALIAYEEKLEFVLASTLSQRSQKRRPVVAFVAQTEPPNPFGPPRGHRFMDLEKSMRETYGSSLRSYLRLDDPIPAEVDVLYLVAPRDLPPQQVWNVEQFVLRGGRLLLLLDPNDIENVWQATYGSEAHASGLEDWLEHLGVTIERGVAGDFDDKAMLRYPLPPSAREWVSYAYWFLSRPEQHDATNPVTRDLAPMPWIWPAPLAIDEAKQKEAGRTVKVLIRTTESGYRRPDLVGLNSAEEGPAGKSLGSIPLLVMLEGPMTSYWKGKAIPGTEAEAGGPPEDDGVPPAPGAGDGGEPAKEGEGASGSGTPAPGEEAPKEGGTPGGAGAGGEPPAEEPGEKPKEPPGDEPKDPGDGDGEADGEEGAAPGAEAPAGPGRLDEGRGRILLATDAEFASNTFGPSSRLSEEYGLSGFDVAVRAPSYLLGSDDLLDVPMRSKKARRLEETSKGDQDLVTVLNVFGAALLVVLAGLTVFIVRRS